MEVQLNVPKSIFGRSRNDRDHRKRKQIMEMMLERETNLNNLFSFKTQPSLIPNPIEKRPIPQCCSICIPNAELAITDDLKHLGLVDCFNPPRHPIYPIPSLYACLRTGQNGRLASLYGWWNSTVTKMFPFYCHYRNVCAVQQNAHQLPTWKELENDPKLLSLYSGTVNEETKYTVLAVIKQLQVKKIWSWMFSTFVRLSAYFWKKYLSIRCFESVLVHQGQIDLLKEVHSKKLPIIYVPAYRSRWDTTLILWVLAHNGLPTPCFISAHNSRKRLAAYYGGIGGSLKTRFDGPSSDTLYSSAVSCYLRNLIRKKNSVMFNLELGRSRKGTPSAQVYGSELLGVIYDEYCDNRIEDAYFVPVSVSYESLPDVKELVSKRSATRNPVKLLFAHLANFMGWTNYKKGSVKVDFAQPLCLREFELSLKKNLKYLRATDPDPETPKPKIDSYHQSRDCTYLTWGSMDSLNSVSSLYGTLEPLYPERVQVANVLDLMNYHLVYDAGKCGSVMATHLVAFLLIKKFHGAAVTLDKLLSGLHWLVKVVKSNKRDFAFNINETNMESIAYRGIQYLGEDVTCRWNNEMKTYQIQPSSQVESLRRVEYFSNFLLPDFLMAGIIATAIFTLIGTELTILRGFDIDIAIKDEDLMYHCRRVYQVFTNTFILHSPCLTSEAATRREISAMGDAGWLFLVTNESRNYHWEDQSSESDDEPTTSKPATAAATDQFTFVPDEVKVTTSEASFEYMDFHRKLLIPYLDIYACLTSSLKPAFTAPAEEVEARNLENHLLTCLLQEADGQFKNCRQLLQMDIVKSFLATCEEHGILQHQHDLDPKVLTSYYGLTENYIDEDGSNLSKQADDILYYVTK